ncbi:hypothetical protein FE391_27050 [Nonomuraea sp. KC401]|uniref:peptidase inhibitor family I36 protein n=1 Tax=unclassified Nonomuraea TaxID=2593643 RepID=UPI0010FD341F|nr:MULTISPECIES: peptidase inhibitor family I36 protein [unclassified Nonomuraea]NBE96007.1 hypothetical protein [Nonomuraea sp. K271]TLF64925.1 hypothetical protein FE391_27050 [Nonomuraea sp. KC401]
MHLTKKAAATMLMAGACVAGTSGAAFATPERAELPGVVSTEAGGVPVATAAAGSLCVYQARDYTSGRYCLSTGDGDLRDNRYHVGTASVNDTVSSFVNRTGYVVEFCNVVNFGTPCVYVPPMSQSPDLGDWDNRFSSIRFHPA